MTTVSEVAADPIVIRESLSLYAGRPGLVSVCSDVDKWVGRRFTTDETGLNAAINYALQLDKRKPKGIYVQVTTLREAPVSGRGGEDLAHCLTYIWADGDFGTIGHKPGPDDLPHPADADSAKKVIAEAIPLEPTVWSNSGGGLNPAYAIEPYIIGDDTDRARIKKFTTDWQAILGATAYKHGFTWDTEVGNVDRLTRLIGTVNRKAEPFRPTWIAGGGGEIYDLEQLLELADRLAPEAHEVMAQANREKQARKAERTKQPIPAHRAASSVRQHSGDGPLDVLADLMRFRDILEPAHFTFRGYHGDGREKYIRPAGADGEASSEYSLLCDEHVAINWSERSDLPVGAQAPGQKLTVGRMYALLNYGGDTSAAAKDIMRAAAGKPTQGPAGSLPAMVLTEVKRRCMNEADRQPARPSFSDDDWTGMEEAPASTQPDEADEPRRIPGLLPEELYAARPELRALRQAAHSRVGSGDVAVWAALARLSGLISHHVRADSGIGGYASLNLFVALVGPSGVGKTTGKDAADLLITAPSELDFRDDLPIGSGEGLAEVFMDTVDEETGELHTRSNAKVNKGDPVTIKVRKQARHNAFFYVDEGRAMTRLMKDRSGSTLGETLRSAAVGATLGSTNASKDTSRYIAKGSYSMGLMVGFQPETAAPLFDEIAEGTPQRFAWGQVLDPSVPEKPPVLPEQLTEWKVATGKAWLTPVTFDQEIKDQLLVAHRAKIRGEAPVEDLDPLDSHRPLMLVKIASLLAILAGRLHVNTDDWTHAGLMWQASCETRTWTIEQATRRRQAEFEQAARARISEAVRTASATADAEQERASKAALALAKRVWFLIHSEDLTSRQGLRKRLNSKQKLLLNEAIDIAVAYRWVTDENGRLELGESRPQ